MRERCVNVKRCGQSELILTKIFCIFFIEVIWQMYEYEGQSVLHLSGVGLTKTSVSESVVREEYQHSVVHKLFVEELAKKLVIRHVHIMSGFDPVVGHFSYRYVSEVLLFPLMHGSDEVKCPIEAMLNRRHRKLRRVSM